MNILPVQQLCLLELCSAEAGQPTNTLVANPHVAQVSKASLLCPPVLPTDTMFSDILLTSDQNLTFRPVVCIVIFQLSGQPHRTVIPLRHHAEISEGRITFHPVILRHQDLLDGVPLPHAYNLVEPQVGSEECAKLLMTALGVPFGSFLQGLT